MVGDVQKHRVYPVDLVVSDACVNCGIGKKTLEALRSVRNVRGLCAVVLWVRALYYLSLANAKPTMRAFLRGWLNRLARLWQTRYGHGNIR